MPTPIIIDGFEHGMVSTIGGWYNTASNCETTEGRGGSGTWALRMQATGSRQLRWQLVSSSTVLVGVVYFKFNANPSNNRTLVRSISSVRQHQIGINASGELYVAISNTTEQTRQTRTGALATGVWHRVEFRFITNAGGSSDTYTIDWSYALGDAVATAQTQASFVLSAGTVVTQFQMDGGDTLGTILDYDDVVVSATSGDYPLGPVTIKGYSPSSSGTHNLDASPSIYLFEHNGTSGVALTTAETAAWTRIDNVPIGSASADYVYATGTPAGTEYAEVNFADTSGETHPWAVSIHESTRQATAGGSVYTSKISDDGAATSTVTNGVDTNTATQRHYGACFASKPSGGAWTVAAVDSLRYRFGYTADATPDVRVYGVMAQVAHPVEMGKRFPTTQVLSDASLTENPVSDGGAWTTVSELTGLQSTTGAFQATASYGSSYRGLYRNAEVYSTLVAANNDWFMATRYQDAGGASPIRDSRRRGYQMTSSLANYKLDRMDDGATGVNLIASTAWPDGNIAANDKTGLRSIGSRHEIWLKRGTAAWLLVAAVEDDKWLGPGAITLQIRTSGSSNRMDDFGGGEVGQYLDMFERPDQTTLGSNWTPNILGAGGWPSLTIASNQAARATNYESNWWNTSFAADQEAFCTIRTMPSNAGRLYARLTNPGLANVTGYNVEWFNGNSYINRTESGSTFTTLLTLGVVFAVGDRVRITCRGNIIAVYRDAGNTGNWKLIGEVQDSAYNSRGYVGILSINNTTFAVDDFGGGDNLTPFPVTSLIDNFNRVNGGLGANWTDPADPTGANTPTIDTNVVLGPTGVFSSAYYNVKTFGPDSECYVTIPAGGTSFSNISLMTRSQNIGIGTYCNYFLIFDSAGGISLSRNYNNSNSGTLFNIALNAVAGWKLGMRTLTVANDIINEIWVDSNNGRGWILRGSYTDKNAVTTYPLLANPGYIAFRQWGNAAVTRSLDNFSGGTVGPESDSPNYKAFPVEVLKRTKLNSWPNKGVIR